MKRVITAAVVLAGVSVTAGSALAQSPANCDLYARQQMEAQYPTGGGLAAGAIGGGIIGGLVAGATNNNVGAGVGIGAAAGGVANSVRWQNLRQQAYTAAYNNCMYSAQPVAAPPPPAVPPPPLPATPYLARTTASSQNVRSHPTTQGSTVLFTVNPSQVFEMQVCDNPEPGWCWIQINGVNGWLARSLTVPVY